MLVALPNPALSNPKMYVPLGPLYVAAEAKRMGYSVGLADMRDGEKPVPSAMVTGFSCTTPEITAAKRIARTLRGKTFTVVGGPHATLCPDDCKDHFDMVVRGEGEGVIAHILSGRVRQKIVNVPRLPNIDGLVEPLWDLFDNPFSTELFPGERYGKADKAATVIWSRGCPFVCSFCGNPMRAPLRFRSVDRIVYELKLLIDKGVTHFRVEDDCINLHPSFRKLMTELRKLNIRYKCHTRSDLLTQEQAWWLKESGCEECGLGVESGDDKVLKLAGKRERAEQHKKAVRLLKTAGLRVKTYLMSGLPGETGRTVTLTKQFMQEAQPHKWTLSTFTPYPGCDIYAKPGKYGIRIINQDWSKWWNFADGFNHELVEPKASAKELWARYEELYKWLKENVVWRET